MRDSKATWWNTPAPSGCSRILETASSEALLVPHPESRLQRVEAPSALFHANLALALQRVVRGAARVEKPSINML